MSWSWKNRWMSLVTALALAGLVALAGACGDDDDENADEARDLAGSLQQFRTALLGTTDIVGASDDVRGTIKDNCDELADGTDDEQVDDFCDELDNAIDDEDQQAYDQVKTIFPAIEQEVTAQIGEDIADVAAEDDDDGPLQGGDDPGDDDNGADDDVDGDDDDVPDVDNPLDDEDDTP
ncbi:MAG: hypothetical protein WD359_07460 [Dehalococcoidia bacterium]